MQTTTDTLPFRRLLSEAEAAAYIGMSRSFLAKSRVYGTRRGHTPGPNFVRVGNGRAVRYDLQVLDQWVEANVRQCPGGGADPEGGTR